MKTFVFVLAASMLAARPAFADLHLTLKDGRVSVVAKDVTVRQILTEWMRVGQTKIVNVDRIPGDPVTLELNNVTETQALDVLLRPLSGYIAAPRAVAAATLSHFDRIIVMPTLATARPVTAPPSMPPPQVSLPAAQTSQPVEQAQYVEQARYEEPQYQEPPYEEPPPPGGTMPAPIGVPAGSRNRNPVTAMQHSQEVSRPGVLPNGIVPQMPTNQPQTFPRSPAAPFGGVAVPGMMVPGAPAGAPVRRP